MPFTNAHHGDTGDRRDLGTRIDAEVRTRIEDAIDFACLDAMVREREARGAPTPVADNPRDRDEYTERVSAFLERLHAELVAGLDDAQRKRLGLSMTPARHPNVTAALAAQVR